MLKPSGIKSSQPSEILLIKTNQTIPSTQIKDTATSPSLIKRLFSFILKRALMARSELILQCNPSLIK